MSATIGHNNPPIPTLPELLAPETVASIIDAALDHEPDAPEGGKLQSIRNRDAALQAMCKRFLTAVPTIKTPNDEALATEVLSTLAKFTGGSGRVETARKSLKEPVLSAGRAIDAAFGNIGTALAVRPLTGPIAARRTKPFTLAEQIANALTAYKDEQDRLQREAAAAEAKRLAAEAAMVAKLAARGSAAVTMEDAATLAEAAGQAQAVADAPAAALTRSAGSNFGTASRKRVRIATIIPGQEHLVPRQYCVPSQSLIDAAKGQPDGPMPVIPGVRIEDVSDLNRR